MSESVRPFVVEFSGDIGPEESDRLAAEGIRWKGRYDALREGWRDELDVNPWITTQVLGVQAGSADAARQRVAEVLGRADP